MDRREKEIEENWDGRVNVDVCSVFNRVAMMKELLGGPRVREGGFNFG